MIEVIDTIVPKNAGGWPVVRQSSVAGGYQVFADVADRDAFDSRKLVLAMLAYTIEENKTWRLTNTSPVSWTEEPTIAAGVAAHVAAVDPHGDRAYVDGYARPGVTALGSDTIVASFAGTRLQTRTMAGAVTLNANNYTADREVVVVITNGTGGALAVTAVGAWVWLTDQPTTLAAGERGVLSLLSTTGAEAGTFAAWVVEA